METTRALAQTGRFSKVYLTSRNPDNGLAALEEVRKTIQIPDMVEHHQLDITDRWSIEEFKVSLSSHNYRVGFSLWNIHLQGKDFDMAQSKCLNGPNRMILIL